MMEIRLEGVGKVFSSGLRALHDVSLTIAPGEWLVLVGASGCGKTTLLRLIAGLETATSGTVRLDGKDVSGVAAWRRNVALAFQRPALLPAQSVRQNLVWPWVLRQREPWRSVRRLCGGALLRPEQEQTLRRVANLLGLDALMNQRADQLSGGQQQRVALGRALVREAGACLLDEPLAHVDAALRVQLRREIRLLSLHVPATMIYVTHDPAEALALGEKIAVLHHGTLQQVDRPDRIYQRPANRAVAELFGQQDGGLNFIAGELNEQRGRRFFAGPWGAWPLPASWQRLTPVLPGITLGIRSRDVRVVAEETGSARVPMKVALTEWGPSGCWLVCEDERGRLTSWLPAGSDIRVGQTLMLEVTLDHGICFDSASGKTLLAPGG
jgi:multiple sugar transport system ATP-binding protein